VGLGAADNAGQREFTLQRWPMIQTREVRIAGQPHPRMRRKIGMEPVCRMIVRVPSSNCWKPRFFSIVATGSSPP
jgi:hypothetical protein